MLGFVKPQSGAGGKQIALRDDVFAWVLDCPNDDDADGAALGKQQAVDSRKYVAAGREAVLQEAARLLSLFASTARETG
jgi:hypothetical protein